MQNEGLNEYSIEFQSKLLFIRSVPSFLVSISRIQSNNVDFSLNFTSKFNVVRFYVYIIFFICVSGNPLRHPLSQHGPSFSHECIFVVTPKRCWGYNFFFFFGSSFARSFVKYINYYYFTLYFILFNKCVCVCSCMKALPLP